MTVSRNDPCPCGSGLKYKKCCMDKKRQLNAKVITDPTKASGLMGRVKPVGAKPAPSAFKMTEEDYRVN
jgi:hypothetical protein